MISKDTLFQYLDTGTIPPGPLTVHIDVANGCNLDCVTCWNHSPHLKQPKPREWKKQQMPLEAFKKILADLEAVKVKKIIISGGGEPFTNQDIYRMIRAARDRGFHVTVITNALLIDPELLLKHPPHKLLVNLGAAGGRSYARVHPNREPEEFHALLERLQRLNPVIPLTLVMVICNLNFTQLPDMVKLASRFPNARLSFKSAGLTEDTAAFALSAKQKKRLTRELIPQCLTLCRESKVRVQSNLDVFARQLAGEGTDFPIHETGCFAGLFYARIHTNGDILYCCAHIKMGNALEEPFSHIWNGPAYQRMRQRLDEKHFFHECLRCGKFNLNLEARRVIEEKGESISPATNS